MDPDLGSSAATGSDGVLKRHVLDAAAAARRVFRAGMVDEDRRIIWLAMPRNCARFCRFRSASDPPGGTPRGRARSVATYDRRAHAQVRAGHLRIAS